jgi:hypothetical protein
MTNPLICNYPAEKSEIKIVRKLSIINNLRKLRVCSLNLIFHHILYKKMHAHKPTTKVKGKGNQMQIQTQK